MIGSHCKKSLRKVARFNNFIVVRDGMGVDTILEATAHTPYSSP